MTKINFTIGMQLKAKDSFVVFNVIEVTERTVTIRQNAKYPELGIEFKFVRPIIFSKERLTELIQYTKDYSIIKI